MTLAISIKRSLQKTYWQYFWNNFQLPEMSVDKVVGEYKQYTPTILEKICLPPYAGNSNYNDYSILISLIRGRQPQNFLELGTAHGNTVANICAESVAQVYTVNALPEQIEGKIITFTLDKDQIGIVYRKNGFENRVVQIYENTKNLNILEYATPKSIDFVFIDACHDAEFVVNDFQRILPALSDRAVVLFHDTHPSGENHLLDSYLGCMYLRKLGYDVNHIAGGSLAYWSNEFPKIKNSLLIQTKNLLHSIISRIIYGNQENVILGIKRLAKGFLRGKRKSR